MIELILASIGKEGYANSFFFWLDLVSTLSLVTDIEPIWNKIIGDTPTNTVGEMDENNTTNNDSNNE